MKILQGILIPLLILISTMKGEAEKLFPWANNSADTTLSSSFHESIYVGTDRKLYIAGEQVWLKVFTLNAFTNAPLDLSRIVFIELLDRLNNPVVQQKINIDGTTGSGFLKLPEGLESGNYQLRGYTSWMLNFSPDRFFSKTISVINPFRDINKLVPPVNHEEGNSQAELSSGSSPEQEASTTGTHENTSIGILLSKGEYETREKVRMTLSFSDPGLGSMSTSFSVSVVKSCLTDPTENKINKGNITVVNKDYQKVPIRHLPDIEGELVRGVIKDMSTNEPLKNTDISLSIVGKIPRIQFERTNDKGEFKFILKNISGLKEIVIQPVNSNIGSCFVEMEPQFSIVFTDNKLPEFYLDINKLDEINKAIISKQVHSLYEPYIQTRKDPDTDYSPFRFYFKPDRRVQMADYIELTDVREIFRELLSEVLVEKRDDESILKVVSSNPYESFDNQALVLVDGVPVYDISALLKVSAAEIESVEIIRSRYFYHNYIFEGIISITTKTGLLSVLDIGNSGYRRVYEACQNKTSFYSPDYTDELTRNNRIPDFRNLLYWNPDLKASTGKDADCEFFTSDEPGDYTVIAEGITPDGKRVFGTSQFVVK